MLEGASDSGLSFIELIAFALTPRSDEVNKSEATLPLITPGIAPLIGG